MLNEVKEAKKEVKTKKIIENLVNKFLNFIILDP